MVRIFGMMAGALFVTALAFALIFTPRTSAEHPEHAFHEEARELDLASNGPFGRFDVPQLQRGLKVYREVCSACHGLTQVSFRSLAALDYNEDQIKALAADWPIQVASINGDTGEAAMRAALPTDRIPSPYPNETAARAANNNAVPPDLSLITKAREGHAPYVYSLLTGYRPVPANLPRALRPPTGLHYNPWFATLNIAMPPPLTANGQVTYDDGTVATVDQMAADVAAFLTWAAEPELQTRHQTGRAVLVFLLIATTLAYLSYKSIWADKKH
jgi:ubiquinol-cytochrome c reductase cytochrome c1 subunit